MQDPKMKGGGGGVLNHSEWVYYTITTASPNIILLIAWLLMKDINKPVNRM